MRGQGRQELMREGCVCMCLRVRACVHTCVRVHRWDAAPSLGLCPRPRSPPCPRGRGVRSQQMLAKCVTSSLSWHGSNGPAETDGCPSVPTALLGAGKHVAGRWALGEARRGEGTVGPLSPCVWDFPALPSPLTPPLTPGHRPKLTLTGLCLLCLWPHTAEMTSSAARTAGP